MLTEEQKNRRMQGIGASESSILFGFNEYSTPYQLWLLKTGQAQPEPENDAMWWGSHMESLIRLRYELETSKGVCEDSETKVCPDEPRMICHLDGCMPVDKKLLEIKTASYNPSKWGVAGSSEVPPEYTIQCQHQLACMPGYESVDLCVFFWQTKSIVIYNIPRDEKLIAGIKDAINRFWNEHVIPKIAPDLFTIKDVKLAYPFDNQKFLEASDVELAEYQKILRARNNLNKFKEEEESYKTNLIILMGENSGIKNNGEFLCTYKANKNGLRSFKLYGESV